MTEFNGSSMMGHIHHVIGEDSQIHPFYEFEPWDIEQERPAWQNEIAKEYGIDLESEELISIFGRCPRPFQTGYLMSDSFIKVMFAGNQVGKTYCVLVDIIIRLTGEIPLSLRHPKGERLKKKRSVNENNIKRFGRRNILTGEPITSDESERIGNFDCGYMEGAGIYPKEKIAPAGAKIWVVTYKQARDEVWWPTLKGMIPDALLDKSRGSQNSRGYDEREHIAYLKGGSTIHFITYEQKATRLEASGELQQFEKLVMIVFDEEPPDSTYYNVALQRVPEIGLVTTPYEGLSWTYDDIFKKSATDPHINIFHATQYDCPYKTRANVDKRRSQMKRWQIGARIFGLHTEQSGKPYYETTYNKISTYLTSGKEIRTPATILPSFVWNSPIELAMRREEVEITPAIDEDQFNGVWSIYEMPKPKTAYWMSVDTAEGSSDESQVQDGHAAHILRLPEKGEPDWPVQVASIAAGMDCDQFANICLYGCAAYNNALLCPEAAGKSAGTFLHCTSGWPFRFMMVVTNDLTKKQTEKYGFYISRKNRTQIFDFVGTMMKEAEDVPMFGLRSMLILKQIAGCIVGKDGRPDHKKRKCNDALVAYCIGCYVLKCAPEQIRFNGDAYKKVSKDVDNWGGRLVNTESAKPSFVLGSRRK
jgi:hypothetical protein